MAEIELSVLQRQCLERRIDSSLELARELAAWDQERHTSAATIRWRFTTADARIQRHRPYPQV